MADASVRGRVLWYELLTTDMKAAEAFYSAVVGWTVTPFAPAPNPYDMWARAGDNMVGGVMPIPQGMNFPPHWGMYVGVDKLEDGVAQVERLKGSALSPVIEVPTVGRMRTMKDPQGAAFSIYEPASPPPKPEAKPEIGDISWLELYTTDAAAAATRHRPPRRPPLPEGRGSVTRTTPTTATADTTFRTTTCGFGTGRIPIG